MELMSCDIVLVKGKGRGIISEIICEVEDDSLYSHSAIIVDINNNVLIEADGLSDVRYNILDNYRSYADIYRCLKLNNSQRKQIVDYLKLQIGKQYDWKLLIWEYIRYKLNIILPWWFENTDSVICSELIYDSFLNIGIDLCPNIKYPSPKDLSESKLLTKIEE